MVELLKLRKVLYEVLDGHSQFVSLARKAYKCLELALTLFGVGVGIELEQLVEGILRVVLGHKACGLDRFGGTAKQKGDGGDGTQSEAHC